jgi:hypothetical protein
MISQLAQSLVSHQIAGALSKGFGSQLIKDLEAALSNVTRYQPDVDKVLRLHA